MFATLEPGRDPISTACKKQADLLNRESQPVRSAQPVTSRAATETILKIRGVRFGARASDAA